MYAKCWGKQYYKNHIHKVANSGKKMVWDILHLSEEGTKENSIRIDMGRVGMGTGKEIIWGEFMA